MASTPSPYVGVLGSRGVGARLAARAQGPTRTVSVVTPYGSVDLTVGRIGRGPFAAAEKSPAAPAAPSQIPYRAGLLALRKQGCDRVLSTSVGVSLSERIRPGDCFLPSDFIDFSGRSVTFFEGGLDGTHHAEMEDPFCPRLVRAFTSAARSFGLRVVDGGTIATVAGPHHPTPAEAERLVRAGAVAVNFSAATEAKLARELGMCYVASVIAVRALPTVGLWREGMREAAPAAQEPTEAEMLGRAQRGEDLGPHRRAASGPARQRRPLPAAPARREREVEALRRQLKDVDERMGHAAAAFVPDASALDPCPRCPKGAGPAWW